MECNEVQREDLKDLSREELVDALYNLTNENGRGIKRVPVPKQVAEERKRLRKRNRVIRKITTALGTLLVVAAAAVLLSTYVFSAIQVSGDSMEPTLSNGDVLVLLNSKKFSGGQLCCVAWQNKMLIKRVIAVSGDSVEIDANGNVSVNGVLLNEPYVTDKSLGECDIDFPFLVPEGKVFVLGDQRATSIDSRSKAVGAVDEDQIVGKVLFKAWPLGGKKN